MQSTPTFNYRCKRCAAILHDRSQLQPHLHWHSIGDSNVNDYFSEEAPTASTADSGPSTDAPPRRSEPSYGVLWGCLAILVALGIAYYMSN